jgi:hypothetical protein
MPVPLRTDFDAEALRAIARHTKDGPQARRLLALAAIYEGASRTEAARIGGVTVQIVRDWVVKFNAHGPEGLVNRRPPGLPPIIFPGRPEGWWGDEALKAETDTPQATLEQRHQATGDILALRRRGFFSAGALFSMASHSPVETAQ